MTEDDKKTLVDPPETRRAMTEPMPTRRRAVAPTIAMTATMPARPKTVLSYQAYSVAHIPPARPALRPPRRTGRRVALAIFGVAIAGVTIAAVVASLDDAPAPAGTTTITSARLAATGSAKR